MLKLCSVVPGDKMNSYNLALPLSFHFISSKLVLYASIILQYLEPKRGPFISVENDSIVGEHQGKPTFSISQQFSFDSSYSLIGEGLFNWLSLSFAVCYTSVIIGYFVKFIKMRLC